MAKITQLAKVEAFGTFLLNEAEMGALEALSGYGADKFLKVFYEHLGRSYLEPHEEGLRSLFGSVAQIRDILERAKKAREAFEAKR